MREERKILVLVAVTCWAAGLMFGVGNAYAGQPCNEEEATEACDELCDIWHGGVCDGVDQGGGNWWDGTCKIWEGEEWEPIGDPFSWECVVVV